MNLQATKFAVKGSICLYTLDAEASFPDGGADFEVLDLSRDVCFKHLPIVTGPPYMRYYYGTTFHTKKGVNIGTVCVLDDKARPAMTREQRLCKHTWAKESLSLKEKANDAYIV